MTNSIYISTAEPNSGKALVALGILENSLRKSSKVGFFKPVIGDYQSGKEDEHISLVIEHFGLNLTHEEAYGLTLKKANELISQGKKDEMLEIVISKYKKLEERFDFILIESSDYKNSITLEHSLNIEFAKNLASPVLVLTNANNKSVHECTDALRVSIDDFSSNDCKVIGAVVNRVDADIINELNVVLADNFAQEEMLLATIPGDERISSPTIRDIAEHLKAKVLYGEDNLDVLVDNITIAAMQMQNFLPKVKPNSLVITPGDRGDIVLGTLSAHRSQSYPNIAGILLTTGLAPDESIKRVIEGMQDMIPVLSVDHNTYITANDANEVTASMRANDLTRISYAKELFAKHVDNKLLDNLLSTVKVEGMTPKMFQYMLTQRAKQKRSRIVLPEGNDPRILEASAILATQDIVDIILLGKEEEIIDVARNNHVNIDFSQVEIIDPVKYSKFNEYVNTLYELRKHKGMNLDMATDAMSDVSYFGTMMVQMGDANGMVSGAVHTTAATIRPALQVIKTKPGTSVVSSVFFMSLPDRVLVYGDCAVNPNPNSEQLSEIAISSAETAISFGIEPKIAMLSYSSGASGSGEEVEKVRKATEIAKAKRPDLKIEGPIQYDAAVDAKVGAQKMPGSDVAGQANVLIFPDLNTGNNTYKAVQRETGALAIGPVLQGLNKPVNDLSRGCLVEDILNTVIITAIQGNQS
ncbi:phosphate acetyltransferase [Flammeovirga kamogawensis]|uniref:Phosphate acetyltransferase n=1 Tax=Flammeovirga kamogawensis TaxID=373891 RepID=A0ABX8GXM2_9BACT|nr:phosphate acetyltransferase [Flammeovirga kamogawensis]MBB6460791.1 phosphate acetyltransferase [Flammeovirga kamogawensis]QWG08144.1 phosphate acetyltransferase [Flammeovirga kamogawensis]TRX69947.1 phosphate acetyltransferase [Flammeovirga kamogawensis]